MIGSRKLRARRAVDAPIEVVWPMLAEFRNWPEWGPTVRKVQAEADVVTPGATGRVQTLLGFWLPFEITNVEPMRSWDWKVAGLGATGHEVSVVTPTRTLVAFTVPVGLAPYVVVLWVGLLRLRRLAEASVQI